MTSCAENFVLSIQSTVVSGYVGNKCASFALQVKAVDIHCTIQNQSCLLVPENRRRGVFITGWHLDVSSLKELFLYHRLTLKSKHPKLGFPGMTKKIAI